MTQKVKDPLQRLPGQSLRDDATELTLKMFWPILAAALACGIAVDGWLFSLLKFSPTPWSLTVMFCIFACFAYWRYRRLKPFLDRLWLGYEGEREVADIIEELRESGYRIVHDILCNGFNIDHALIGPTGVYAIETKSRSKGNGRESITYEGIQVLIAGKKPDRDPISQAEANAKTLGDILFDQTGKRVRVRAIVLFPNWWVESSVQEPNTPVLNPKQIFEFLRMEPEKLSAREIEQLYKGIVRHQQTEERIRAATTNKAILRD